MNSNIDQKIFASTFKKVGENTQQITRALTSSNNTNVENQQEVVSSQANEAIRNNSLGLILAQSKTTSQSKTLEEIMQNLCQKCPWDEHDKEQIKNALTISIDNPDVVKNQFVLAQKAIRFLDKYECQAIITNLLSNPNIENPDILQKQLELADNAVMNDFFDENNQAIITNLLSNPNIENPDILQKQLELADSAIRYLDVGTSIKIVKNLLATPNIENPDILQKQFLFADSAIMILDVDTSIEVIKNLLATPDIGDSDILQKQLELAQKAIKFFDDYKIKELATNLLNREPQTTEIFQQQHDLLHILINNKTIDIQNDTHKNWLVYFLVRFFSKTPHNLIPGMITQDNDIITKLLQTSENISNPTIDPISLFQNQLLLAQQAIRFLNVDTSKELVTNLLTPPKMENPLTFYYQLLLAKDALKEDGFFDENNKTIITNLLATPNMGYPDILEIQLLLAQQALNKDGFFNENNKTIITNLLQYTYNYDDIPRNQLKIIRKAIEKDLSVKDAPNVQKFINDISKSITSRYISIEKNIPLLSNEQLRAINESQFIKDTKEDRKQFELEYIIDLKISRGLYQDNWDSLAQTIIDNASILTPEANTDIYNDGVFNISVTALKQIPLAQRTEFLNKILSETNNENLKQLLNDDNQCDNDKLLTIRPVLRQYDKKVGLYESKQHSYRMPRTTDRCEVFGMDGKTMLGYKGSSQYIETTLTQDQIKYLFGEQRPDGNQSIGNCWLVSELKHIMYDTQLKLFIMSRFSMEQDGGVSITLKNGKKVTFTQDVVKKASEIAKEEHLPPAMACLSLLAATNRTHTRYSNKDDNDLQVFKEDLTITEASLKEAFQGYELPKDTDITFNIITIKANEDPIIYALRKFNNAGQAYKDLLSLFFDKAPSAYVQEETSIDNKIIKNCINTPGHAWSVYDDILAANPQHSNTLFDTRSNDNDNNDESVSDNFSQDNFYYIPNIDPSTHKFYTA